MTKGIKKKPHSAEFKFKVAIEAIREEKTIEQLCSEYSVVSSQIYKWKKAVLAQGSLVFKDGNVPADSGNEKQIDQLHATIGRLKVENDFLAKVLGKCR